MDVQPEGPTLEELSAEGLCSRLGLPYGIENYAPALPAVFSCDQSSYQYSAQQHLQENRTSERPQRLQGRYRCAYCPYFSHYKGNVARHEKIHTGERPFPCNYCGRSFTRKHLANHWLVHSEQKLHVCANCGQRFSLATNLTRHLREQHSADGLTTLHMCGDCGKSFTLRSDLNRHKLMLSKEKPHAC